MALVFLIQFLAVFPGWDTRKKKKKSHSLSFSKFSIMSLGCYVVCVNEATLIKGKDLTTLKCRDFSSLPPVLLLL